jgi:hypothetical protein
MQYNNLNIKVGDKCTLDADFNNTSIVTVKHLSEPNGMFATVEHADGDTWDVMTNRLTPIDETSKLS